MCVCGCYVCMSQGSNMYKIDDKHNTENNKGFTLFVHMTEFPLIQIYVNVICIEINNILRNRNPVITM